MPYFALFYHELAAGYLEKRAAHREDHLRLARESYDRGELIFGGALADPVDGALLVFQADSASVVEEFVKRDPYVRSGLIKRWSIRPWTVVVGNGPHPRVAQSAAS